MIDTVDGTTKMSHALSVAVNKKKSEHATARGNHYWGRIKTPYGSFKVTIDIADGTLKTGPVSPMALLKGHNVFGTNKPTLLLVALMRHVHAHFKIPFTAADEQRYRRQGFELDRLDITGGFLVESQAQVVDTIGLIRQNLLLQGCYIVVHENAASVETIYIGKHSSRSSDKFYNKYLEMKSKDNKGKPSYWAEVLKFAERQVRYERVLRREELKKLGRTNSNDWSPTLVREELNKRLAELGLNNTNLVDELDDAVVGSLTPKRKTLYGLWADGADIKKHSATHTFNREHEFFLKHGLDIAWTRRLVHEAVTLSARVQPTLLRMTYPKRFVPLGAVFR